MPRCKHYTVLSRQHVVSQVVLSWPASGPVDGLWLHKICRLVAHWLHKRLRGRWITPAQKVASWWIMTAQTAAGWWMMSAQKSAGQWLADYTQRCRRIKFRPPAPLQEVLGSHLNRDRPLYAFSWFYTVPPDNAVITWNRPRAFATALFPDQDSPPSDNSTPHSLQVATASLTRHTD